MKSSRTNRRIGTEGFKDEFEQRQKNTVWPDTIRNTVTVDRLLWFGSAKATGIQRIGILVFGLAFFIEGVAFVYWWTWTQNGFVFGLGILLALLGARVCIKAFLPKHKRK